MKKIVEKYVELPVAIRKPLWQLWHWLITRFDRGEEATFMNYGFEPAGADPRPALAPEDEANRYCIQLYDHVARQGELEGRDVLEVGSGRGGGASYIARYFQPRTYTAMDISQHVVNFCTRHHGAVGNLRFVRGVAEKLPFASDSFDAVVNVESARCYASLTDFFRETHRVLRPGGRFLFADMIKREDVAEMAPMLAACGFRIHASRDISQNVVEALDKDHERRALLIARNTPAFLRSAFAEFAGTKGSDRYAAFASGEIQYWSFLLERW
jgi:SAM-dependent methyltransferase